MRDELEAYRIEQGLCGQCGGDPAACGDVATEYFPQRTICYVTMALKVNQRKYDKLHEKRQWHDGTGAIWNEKFSKVTPFHYLDGVSIWVSRFDLTPDDDFLGQSVGAAEEGAGDADQADQADQDA